MSDTKLLPCPWCGRNPSIERSGPGNLVWYIECDRGDGDAEHVITILGGGTRKQAIAAWNTRVDPQRQALVDALKDANAWIFHGDGKSPAKYGATCETLTDALEKIEQALRDAGESLSIPANSKGHSVE